MLFNQLASSVHAGGKKNTGAVLGNLLTDTEQLMLAKRLAVILMLYEGCSSYRIWKALRMSPSTISRMQQQYDEGDYNDIVRLICKSKAERERFWETIETVLRGGMPSMGKDRWRSLRNM